MARRIQRQRTKGWKAPAGAINVARPSFWGNPIAVSTVGSRERAKAAYADYLNRFPEIAEAARRQLRGRDLMCFCPLDEPCHADVLLEVANDG